MLSGCERCSRALGCAQALACHRESPKLSVSAVLELRGSTAPLGRVRTIWSAAENQILRMQLVGLRWIGRAATSVVVGGYRNRIELNRTVLVHNVVSSIVGLGRPHCQSVHVLFALLIVAPPVDDRVAQRRALGAF